MTEALTKPNFSLIPAYEFFAVQKRYEGLSYNNISQEIEKIYNIHVPPGTIKWWFYKGGRLAPFYREYADTMVAMEIEEVQDFIRGNVSKAAKVLAGVMQGSGGMAQVAAANAFLDRGLGKSTENINQTVKHSGTIGIATLDVLKAIKEAKQNEQRAKDQYDSTIKPAT